MQICLHLRNPLSCCNFLLFSSLGLRHVAYLVPHSHNTTYLKEFSLSFSLDVQIAHKKAVSRHSNLFIRFFFGTGPIDTFSHLPPVCSFALLRTPTIRPEDPNLTGYPSRCLMSLVLPWILQFSTQRGGYCAPVCKSPRRDTFVMSIGWLTSRDPLDLTLKIFDLFEPWHVLLCLIHYRLFDYSNYLFLHCYFTFYSFAAISFRFFWHFCHPLTFFFSKWHLHLCTSPLSPLSCI